MLGNGHSDPTGGRERVLMRWLVVAMMLLGGQAVADESVGICHGYGCVAQASIRFTDGQLGDVRRMLLAASDAASERRILADVIGLFYGWAGEQSDIHNDRAGNFDDGYRSGRMDCIDHSTSTTRLLNLLAARGYLRWHRVLEPEVRSRISLFFVHWTAVIEELWPDGDLAEAQPPGRFAVDSWFVDNGYPAVILPLDEWKRGAGPDV